MVQRHHLQASSVATSMEPIKQVSELFGEIARIDWHTATWRVQIEI